MTALEALAAHVHDFDATNLTAAARARLELHVLDTLGAGRVGATIAEGAAIGRFVEDESSGRLDDAILARVAATRASEMDDIHLASCTTPGSVVVPTALALASSGRFDSRDALFAAIAVGYDVVVRAGLSIDGPRVLEKGIWPTLFAAPLASAAVASRAYGLSVEQASGAFATALALTSATPIRRPGGATSRWLTLGAAARGGVVSARAAKHGILGNADLLEQLGSRIAGVPIDEKRLLDELGHRFHLDDVSLKPYPVARQALAAAEASRRLAETHRLDPESIDAVVVRMPAAQARVVDRPGEPRGRFASIVSAPYLVALAVCAPEHLGDVTREPVYIDDAVRRLMARVRIEPASEELDAHYPNAWPAEVEMTTKAQTFELRVLHPAGDATSGFGWDDVIAKYRSGGASSDELELDTIAPNLRDARGDAWRSGFSKFG